MKFSKEQFFKTLQYLLMELIIVFIGVYLAFQLNNYQDKKETEHRKEQLRTALAQEINFFILGADQLLPQLDTAYINWRKSYENGEKPIPIYFKIGEADLPPRGMWETALASDGLAVISVSSMKVISQYYNALEILLN